jgi:hypothetical protein
MDESSNLSKDAVRRGCVHDRKYSTALKADLVALYLKVMYGSATESQDLSKVIRQVARRASIEGLQAEQMVVALRTAWRDTALSSSVLPVVREQTLVSALITAYYESEGTAPRDRSARGG